MWILTKEDIVNDAVFYLPCGDSLKVGRSQRSTIALLNDNSVSRDHASIFIIHNDKNLNCVEKIPEVILQDLSSTYGTYVNAGICSKTKVPSNDPQHLKDNDRIRFGVLDNVFTLKYNPLVVTSSQLVSQEQLRLDLLYLGGHLVKEWTSKCSLLAMQELKLTAKTVSALATGSHIVTPTYFKDMVTAVKSRLSLPDPSLYLPQLKEPSINGRLVSFSPDPIRRSLFSGKTFLFQKKVSLRKMRAVVSFSGGQPIELLESNFHKVTESNHILVKSLEKENEILPSFIIEANRLLEQKGLVAIPESDIGLAILYKNVEKYCNPKFKVAVILQTSVTSQPLITQPLQIYATETQYDSEFISPVKKNLPSTFISCTTIVETGMSTRNNEQMTSKTDKNPASHQNLVTTCSDKTLELECSGCHTSDTFVSTNAMTELAIGQIEEKENLGKRKRERSSSLDKSASPINKRRSFLLVKTNLEKHGILKESVDLVENPIPKTVELNADVFEPMHFSTEKISFPEKKNLTEHENLLANSNSVSVSKTSKSNIRRTSLTLNCSTESENSLMSEDNRVAKSIPFEPYTLPSLDYHQSINHSIQAESAAQTVIKTEPQCPSTFRSERKIDSPDQENCLVKRELEDTRPSQTDMKRRRSSPSPERACNNDANLFAIPFPSARQKRRAKESTITSLNLKVPQESNAKDLTTNVAPESTQSIINNIKKEGTEVSESCLKKQQTNSLNTNPFINKDTQQQNPLSKANDVSKLGEVLERSLMVVEVVSLIRLIQPSNATTLNTTSTGLTNFKRFRKVTNLSQNSIIVSRNENAALPKIIGGCDLIAHSAANSRREEFIASQPSENAIVNQRNEEVDSTNSALDPTFLQPFPNMSRRRRVR